MYDSRDKFHIALGGSLTCKLDPRLQGLLFILSWQRKSHHLFVGNWEWGGDLYSWCSSGVSERCAMRWVPLSLCFPICKTWMVYQPPRILWEFHEQMPGEFLGQRKSLNVVLSFPHLSPPTPPAFSLRTSPLLSCLGLTLSNWSIQATLTQSSQLHFKTPSLFLSITSILILELMSIDGDVCAHLWPQNGCMCWLPLVSSSVEDRKQISCLKVVLCTWNSL